MENSNNNSGKAPEAKQETKPEVKTDTQPKEVVGKVETTDDLAKKLEKQEVNSDVAPSSGKTKEEQTSKEKERSTDRRKCY